MEVSVCEVRCSAYSYPSFPVAAESLTCFALTARLIACSSHVVDANPLILPYAGRWEGNAAEEAFGE